MQIVPCKTCIKNQLVKYISQRDIKSQDFVGGVRKLCKIENNMQKFMLGVDLKNLVTHFLPKNFQNW